ARPERRPTWVTTAKPGRWRATGRDTWFVTWLLNRATAFGMAMRAQHKRADARWVPWRHAAALRLGPRWRRGVRRLPRPRVGGAARAPAARRVWGRPPAGGARAGLWWATTRGRRGGSRRAFADFDAAGVARFARRRVQRPLRDPDIGRTRLKVESTVNNARRV